MLVAMLEYAVARQARRGDGQDRVAVIERADGELVIALADGAGGTSHGEQAAHAVIDLACTLAETRAPVAAWSAALTALDQDERRLGGGQTTALMLHVTPHGIAGLSVGHGEAWLVAPAGQVEVLTAEQVRTPLLGAGVSLTSIRPAALGEATLVVASDGLFRHARATDIARLAAGASLDPAAGQLVELVRTGVGRVFDDVTVVLCRRRDGTRGR